ncbi:hypothetical protein SAMD00019534_018180 [Acytostelium subglobosum LB1]|uniref:hypothetical protein n=1 Tax=Acytostelium subglobosum LB1 TaxID=1410327 RepID=UPI000644B222|nr:hypothetical protein SAMD00019534_018180 [Acytostelium subglobosum LB1]GAM18643.1 hypothetical protein SAMD00019534_018180 [Acytostelium subglobosum LB1]|eukprot:XP_012757863.1 hypothetical protein SAMD00019534_018180 [Acytostelium subglobosum LB1]
MNKQQQQEIPWTLQRKIVEILLKDEVMPLLWRLSLGCVSRRYFQYVTELVDFQHGCDDVVQAIIKPGSTLEDMIEHVKRPLCPVKNIHVKVTPFGNWWQSVNCVLDNLRELVIGPMLDMWEADDQNIRIKDIPVLETLPSWLPPTCSLSLVDSLAPFNHPLMSRLNILSISISEVHQLTILDELATVIMSTPIKLSIESGLRSELLTTIIKHPSLVARMTELKINGYWLPNSHGRYSEWDHHSMTALGRLHNLEKLSIIQAITDHHEAFHTSLESLVSLTFLHFHLDKSHPPIAELVASMSRNHRLRSVSTNHYALQDVKTPLHFDLDHMTLMGFSRFGSDHQLAPLAPQTRIHNLTLYQENNKLFDRYIRECQSIDILRMQSIVYLDFKLIQSNQCIRSLMVSIVKDIIIDPIGWLKELAAHPSLVNITFDYSRHEDLSYLFKLHVGTVYHTFSLIKRDLSKYDGHPPTLCFIRCCPSVDRK